MFLKFPSLPQINSNFGSWRNEEEIQIGPVAVDQAVCCQKQTAASLHLPLNCQLDTVIHSSMHSQLLDTLTNCCYYIAIILIH